MPRVLLEKDAPNASKAFDFCLNFTSRPLRRRLGPPSDHIVAGSEVMNFRVLSVGITALIVGVLIASPAATAGTVTINTKTVDHALESMTITCDPPGTIVDIDTLLDNMTEQQMDHLMQVVSQFESQNGVEIESETVTDEDGNVVSDTITSTSTGPDTGIGQELCDLVRLHSGADAASSGVSRDSAASSGAATTSRSSSRTGSSATTTTRSRSAGTRSSTTRSGTSGSASRGTESAASTESSDQGSPAATSERPSSSANTAGSSRTSRSASRGGGGGPVTVNTQFRDHVLEGWTISCPAGDGHPAIMIDVDKLFDNMTEAEMEKFSDLVSQFESQNGVRISSTTKIRDSVAQSDKIDATSTGPARGVGEQLCDMVRQFAD